MNVGLGSGVQVVLAHPCAPRHSGVLPIRRTIRAVRHLFNSIWNAQLKGAAQGIQKGKLLEVSPTYKAVVTSFPFWRCGMQYHDF